MVETEYNLLSEKWILAMRPDGEVEKLSLTDAIICAHRYQRLAGELPTQDTAILRVLLAVLHAVFARYAPDGSYAPLLEDADPPAAPIDAIARWKELWEGGSFPQEPIRRYLDHFRDRFFLFHPEHPFFQVPLLPVCTSYSASKLNGEVSQSGNKLRLFSVRSGEKKEVLDYDEAARWLIYVNAFDDASGKPKKTKGEQEKYGSSGTGWLGRLGLIIAQGENLFETLMLNLVLLKDGRELWEEELPIWEDAVHTAQRSEIPMPNNLSALYTLQSRRLLLIQKEGQVNQLKLLGGDFFSEENAFVEQMTLWHSIEVKKRNLVTYFPRSHSPGCMLWRDFAPIAITCTGSRRPGLVSFLARLKAEHALNTTILHFQTTCVKYDNKHNSVIDTFGDELAFNAELLTALGEQWMPRIQDAIALSENLVRQLGAMAADLEKCRGNTTGEGARETAREQGYYTLDLPFRSWLEPIDPSDQDADVNEICEQWFTQAQQLIRALGREMVAHAGSKAFVGRTELDQNKKEVRYTAPEVYNRFLYYTSEEYLKGVK